MKKLIICLTGFLSLIIIVPCYGGECPGDITCNGVVDGSDLADFANDYGKDDCDKCIAAPIPATGQLTPYAVGDDGNLKMGVAWPYPRFTDNDDGTVKDELTGLIWLKNANCPIGSKIWSDAITFANSLYDGWTGDGSGGDCGLSDGSSTRDWRLPNVRELHSLIDFSNYDPALPSGHPFTGVQSNSYWSSTNYAGYTVRAWYVHMGDGFVGSSDEGDSFYVWPVRNGTD